MSQVHRLQWAAVAAVALLLGFQSVVRQSVRRGETQREAVTRQAAAWSDCSRLPRRSEREACRAGVPSVGSLQGAISHAP